MGRHEKHSQQASSLGKLSTVPHTAQSTSDRGPVTTFPALTSGLRLKETLHSHPHFTLRGHLSALADGDANIVHIDPPHGPQQPDPQDGLACRQRNGHAPPLLLPRERTAPRPQRRLSDLFSRRVVEEDNEPWPLVPIWSLPNVGRSDPAGEIEVRDTPAIYGESLECLAAAPGHIIVQSGKKLPLRRIFAPAGPFESPRVMPGRGAVGIR